MNLRKLIYLDKCENCFHQWYKHEQRLCGNIEKIKFNQTPNFCKDYNQWDKCGHYLPMRIREQILAGRWSQKMKPAQEIIDEVTKEMEEKYSLLKETDTTTTEDKS